MFQNEDKWSRADGDKHHGGHAAQRLFDAKKRIGPARVAGWGARPTPHHEGCRPVGVLVKQTFTEVKVIDRRSSPGDGGQAQAVMKDVAAKKERERAAVRSAGRKIA